MRSIRRIQKKRRPAKDRARRFEHLRCSVPRALHVRSIAVLHALRYVAFIVEAVGDFHPWRDRFTLRELLRDIARERTEERARLHAGTEFAGSDGVHAALRPV